MTLSVSYIDTDRPDNSPATDGADRIAAQKTLDLIEAQGRTTAQSLSVNPVPILAAWGLAWLVGFGAVYLASQNGPGPLGPMWLAVTILGVLFAIAMTVSICEGVRRGRGVEGPSREVVAMYGWGWTLALAALFAVNLGLAQHGLPRSLRPLVWSGSALLVVGLLYLATGIVWRDRVQYGLGVWTLIVGTASVSAGVPANFAVPSLAGGGGFLVATALAQAGTRRSRHAK